MMKVLLVSALLALSPLAALSPRAAATELTVFKSPTCGCCGDWIDHMKANGFDSHVEHPQNLAAVKQQLGIGPQLRSCHTSVSQAGFVFEGHVPAKYVRQFLAAPPQGAIGLSVPAMPVGSPGMEMGDKFMPYQVLLLKQDGNTEVYASIDSPQDQVTQRHMDHSNMDHGNMNHSINQNAVNHNGMNHEQMPHH
ncbi:MAG: metal-binding protein [Oceanospirillaceae bacterium]|uniref:DUF411 domain-containing protein n=1 Tax=unclassified Thalassolituus TaxID=2624967 RepID=UPI000C5C05A1|nr:metal-binding protein [Oceanospirillaceae bacterium]MAX99975.1 metal-binding protein [Oceanospirillaceae bacterium]MBL36162.1 metal-binding protein [Oceanospirillaceae bacterium]MBS53066.1 metal-binding protein [Oceanospirillaceae bacterium]|tara:strand:- start:194 stop:775 length:582 start_codon:yes stop_codon:yes gene_type:complete